jgi:hypothetical protein
MIFTALSQQPYLGTRGSYSKSFEIHSKLHTSNSACLEREARASLILMRITVIAQLKFGLQKVDVLSKRVTVPRRIFSTYKLWAPMCLEYFRDG